MADALQTASEVDIQTPPFHERFFTKGMLITLGIMVLIFVLSGVYLLYQNASPEKQESIKTLITRISPTPLPQHAVKIPSPTPSETPLWTEYTNTTDNYMISYQHDWNVRVCPTDQKCSSTDTATYFESTERIGSGSEFLAYTVFVQHWLNPEHKSFKDLVGGGLHLSLQKDFHFQSETVGGVNRIRTSSLPVPFGAEFVFFPKTDGSFVSVAITPYSKDNPYNKQDSYLQIFENMVSSLRITQ